MAMYSLCFLCALGLLASIQLVDQQKIVDIHNAMRRGVQPPASNMLKMSWNKEAAKNAEKWARTCAMYHSGDSSRKITTSGCGENLFMSGNKHTWDEVIHSWYDEVKNYQYGNFKSINKKPIGHYTQVVWYKSYQVGCAMAHCPNSESYKYFYVCHYCPPGNFFNTLPYSQGPSCSACPHDCDNKLCTNSCPYTDKYTNCADLKRWQGSCRGSVSKNCPATCKCDHTIQ